MVLDLDIVNLDVLIYESSFIKSKGVFDGKQQKL